MSPVIAGGQPQALKRAQAGSGSGEPAGKSKRMALSNLIAQREALERQQAELTQLIAEAQMHARREGLARIRQLMAEHGLTAADLAESGRGKRAPKPLLADAPAPSRGKVAAKYRDPNTGESWSGRGLMPKWLRAAVDAGRSRDEFAV